LKPSKEVYEKLGFVFDCEPGKQFRGVLQPVVFPPGWSLKVGTNPTGFIITDEKQRERGWFFYHADLDSVAPNGLNYRLAVRNEYSDNKNKCTVYFGEDGSGGARFLVAGSADRSKHKVRGDYLSEIAEYEAFAASYGDKVYPKYKDITAYWDDSNFEEQVKQAKKKALQTFIKTNQLKLFEQN